MKYQEQANSKRKSRKQMRDYEGSGEGEKAVIAKWLEFLFGVMKEFWKQMATAVVVAQDDE